VSEAVVGHRFPEPDPSFTPEAMRPLADQDPEVWSDLRADFEGWVARVVRAGGLDAVRAQVTGLNGRGFRFQEVRETETTLALATPLPPDGSMMEIEATSTEYWISGQLSFSEPEPTKEEPTAPEVVEEGAEGKKADPPAPDPRHEAFYELWEAMIGLPEAEVLELDGTRRAVYLVALLEAELNNGGFGQYLDNTEGTLLEETLEVLEKIDAPDTHRLLGEVARLLDETGIDPTDAWEDMGSDLEKLDDEFLLAAEDLAGAVMDVYGA